MSAIATVKALINGVEHTLTYNSATDAYEASISAPTTTSWNLTDHVYPVSITATDAAGNTTTVDSSDSEFGAALKLRVKETVSPVVSFVTPTNNAGLTTAKPTFKVRVTDSGSGVDPSTFSLKIDNGNPVSSADYTYTAITDGYEFTYTPSAALADGSHTIVATASDYDGNTSSAVSITIKIDTVPPTLILSSPENNSFTNVASCVVPGTTNDEHSSPVTVTVNGEAVTVNSDGSFSTTITLNEGENTITVVATDSVGKTTTIQRVVTLDTSAPVFTAVSVTPNPVDCGATYKISVKVSS